MIRYVYILCLAVFLLCAGCVAGQQRGMYGNAYISTARPAIKVAARDLPLITAGRGSAFLTNTSVVSGLPVNVWLALYGKSPDGPFAVVAQAEVPHGWYWDSIMRRPFSINEGVELLGGMGFQACTFVIDNRFDPFVAQAWLGRDAKEVTQRPARWLVRAFAARCNFDEDKIILEYREPLPADIHDISSLPFGQDDLVRDFEQRARQAFTVGTVPQDISGITIGYPYGIEWRYMRERFLGTASKYDIFDIR